MSERFYIDGVPSGTFVLDGPEAHHLTTVRRFAIGDAVALFNGDGYEYPSVIESIGKREVVLRVSSAVLVNREPAIGIEIASAVPKGDRLDFLIEKLTEVGCTDFFPLTTARSIVKVDAGKADKMRRMVIEASKQCGRNRLMRIHAPLRFADYVSECRAGHRRIALTAPGERSPIPDGLRCGECVAVLIGPEGGWSPEEAERATASGWQSVTLGSRILRMETAAILAAGILAQSPAGKGSA